MKIKAFFCDFDGVFTDNSVFIDENGKESVLCNRSDGIGISYLKENNVYFCIVSSEVVPIAKFRAKKLSIDCYTAVKNKYDLIDSLQKKMSLNKSECAFLGNDVNDIPAFHAVELKIAVRDSHEDILDLADLILTKEGGKGAVREACEYIIKRNKSA